MYNGILEPKNDMKKKEKLATSLNLGKEFQFISQPLEIFFSFFLELYCHAVEKQSLLLESIPIFKKVFTRIGRFSKTSISILT